jgi:hypothetical protein
MVAYMHVRIGSGDEIPQLAVAPLAARGGAAVGAKPACERRQGGFMLRAAAVLYDRSKK